MKLIVGYDGSDCSNAAIDDLHSAGLPQQGQAMVVAVADSWPHLKAPDATAASANAPSSKTVEAARAIIAQDLEEARCTAIRGAARLRKVLPGWQVEELHDVGSPAVVILQRSDAWRPDLIVIGSHGRSALGRLILGSVSHSVLLHARCSVRISRPTAVGTPAGLRLIVAIDGSVDAAVAVSAVTLRRWPAGTQARVVSVVDKSAGSPHEVASAADQVCRELTESGIVATPALIDGNPRRAIVEEAAQFGAHCIFVGAKGLSRMERLLIGSVSMSVASHAHCSVEVVRPSA